MQISKETLRVLKNFSNIENSIYVDEKNTLKIINNSSSIIGIAQVEDEFSNEFGIYNLSEFIQALSIFEDPELDFSDNSVVIKQGKKKVDYRLTPKDLIPFKTKASEVYIKNTQKCDAVFELKESELQNVLKASRIFGCDVMKIELENGKGQIHLYNTKNSSNNTYTEKISGARTGNISLIVNNIDFLPGDYEVSIVSNKFVKFQNKQSNVFYIVTAFIG